MKGPGYQTQETAVKEQQSEVGLQAGGPQKGQGQQKTGQGRLVFSTRKNSKEENLGEN